MTKTVPAPLRAVAFTLLFSCFLGNAAMASFLKCEAKPMGKMEEQKMI